MKKKDNILINFLLAILLTLLTGTTYAQLQKDLKDEILVYIQPEVLDFPPNVSRSVAIDSLVVRSPEFMSVMQNFNIRTIAKAFPNFADSDTIRFNKGIPVKIPQFSRIFSVHVPKITDIDFVIEELEKLPGVLYAEKQTDAYLFQDSTYSNQWHLNNTGQSGGTAGADIKAEDAWSIFTGSSSIKIGIIDSGVETNHEDLSGKASGDPSSSDYHGTHVAGIAAAKANNHYGGRGVDWNAQILSKRIFNPYYVGDATAANKIISAVDNGANILNHSWGGSNFKTTVRLAFSYAYKMDRVSVVAMGNNNGSQTQYPAGYGKGVIAVGSTQDNDFISPFSNIGNHIDVSAPGGLNTNPNDPHNIWSTWGGNSYIYDAGTSMAAPVVSGIASLLKGYNTNLYNDDIEQIIRLTSEDLGAPGFDNSYGTGRVNAYKALKLISSPNQIVRLGTYTGGTVASVGNTTTANLYGVPGIPDGTYSVTRYEVIRDVTFPQYMSSPLVPGMTFNLPQAWGNGTATAPSATGLPYYTGDCAACCNGDVYIYGLPHTEVVPGTVTHTGVRLRTYVYRLRTLYYISGVCVPNTDLGYFPTSPSNVQFAATVIGIPGINKSNQLTEVTTPQVFSLGQNYPNPFNPTTTIRYTLPKESHVTLRIYNTLGQEIITLVNETEEVGYHETIFDATSLSSGVYFYKIQAGSYQAIKKLLVMK